LANPYKGTDPNDSSDGSGKAGGLPPGLTNVTTYSIDEYGMCDAGGVGVHCSDEHAQIINDHRDELAVLVDSFMQRVRYVKGPLSTKLTPAGQREKVQEYAKTVLPELNKVDQKYRAKVETDLKRMNLPDRLPTVRELAKASDLPESVMYDEIIRLRDDLRKDKADGVLRTVLLLTAVAANDTSLIVAAGWGHPRLRPADDDLMTEVTARWVKSRKTLEAKVIELVLKVLRSNLVSARQYVAKEAGLDLNGPDVIDLPRLDPKPHKAIVTGSGIDGRLEVDIG
jgi:hypothetical protein